MRTLPQHFLRSKASMHTFGDITATCGMCGSQKMAYSENLEPDSAVHCGDCGAFLGTISGFKALAEVQAGALIDQIAGTLGKSLKLK
jgi:ribosomal protein S27E